MYKLTGKEKALPIRCRTVAAAEESRGYANKGGHTMFRSGPATGVRLVAVVVCAAALIAGCTRTESGDQLSTPEATTDDTASTKTTEANEGASSVESGDQEEAGGTDNKSIEIDARPTTLTWPERKYFFDERSGEYGSVVCPLTLRVGRSLAHVDPPAAIAGESTDEFAKWSSPPGDGLVYVTAIMEGQCGNGKTPHFVTAVDLRVDGSSEDLPCKNLGQSSYCGLWISNGESQWTDFGGNGVRLMGGESGSINLTFPVPVDATEATVALETTPYLYEDESLEVQDITFDLSNLEDLANTEN